MDMVNKNKDKIGAKDVILARVNPPFDIALDSIPTAGYVWTLEYECQSKHRRISNLHSALKNN